MQCNADGIFKSVCEVEKCNADEGGIFYFIKFVYEVEKCNENIPDGGGILPNLDLWTGSFRC